MTDDVSSDLPALTADIVSAYVSNNKVGTAELASLIADVHKALGSVGQSAAPVEPEAPKPDKGAVRKSMSPDFLTSFIDGRKYKSLKRHLSTKGMTPDEYRTRYGLPKDYPMVAPNYSAQRSELARSLGLGRKAAAPAATPTSAPEAPAKRGRRKATSESAS